MLIIMIAAVVIVGAAAFAVCSSEKPSTVVEHHHHRLTVKVERPVYIQAQISVIQAQIFIADAKNDSARCRLPVARLINPSAAIRRYRAVASKEAS